MIDKAAGGMKAAPSPWKALAVSIMNALRAMPVANDARVKKVLPPMDVCFPPSTPADHPPSRRNPQ